AGRDSEHIGARLDVALRRLHGLPHHVAELAGRRDAALARHRHRLDRQQLTADLGPGKAGRDADQIGLLDLAEAELPHAGEFLEIAARYRDLVELLEEKFLDR